MMKDIIVLLFLRVASTLPVKNPLNVTLPPLHKNDLVLYLMGDTQYHFPCETSNFQCKKASKRCRNDQNLGYDFRPRVPYNDSKRLNEARLACIKIESRFANRVQRQNLLQLINNLKYQPSALIINGDLTDFGHMHQFSEFKNGWMTNFPIPIFAGLGNHDVQNNIDDCMFNFCAHTMLTWLTTYAKNNSLDIDYERQALSAFDVKYKGTFAYSTRTCSVTGRNCVNILQLNNAFDYHVSFSSLLVQWQVLSPADWLIRKLDLLADSDIPILINMHQNEMARFELLWSRITAWLEKLKYLNKKPPRLAVFFAHMHGKHHIRSMCFEHITVPFVYVGSVPNNRFSGLRITDETAMLIGYSATEKGPRVLGVKKDLWAPCNDTTMDLFAEVFPYHSHFDESDLHFIF